MAESISFTIDFPDLENQINSGLKKELDQFIIIFSSKFEKICKDDFIREIEDNVDYQSLLNDELEAELGLPIDIRDWIQHGMLEILRDGIKVEKVNSNDLGEFQVLFQNEIPNILLNDQHAEYNYVSGLYPAGNTIPWLAWLFGTIEPIIYGFDIEYGSFANSRSGKAIMVPSKEDWSLPYEYQESINRNFITESLGKFIKKLPDLVQRAI